MIVIKRAWQRRSKINDRHISPVNTFSLSPAFTSACDSQGASSTPTPSTPPPPALPCCHADAARLEEEYVHRVYDAIASHFSSTRHSPWPRVCHFLSSLPPGSVLADVGCGNGKYLGVNPEMIAVSVILYWNVCASEILHWSLQGNFLYHCFFYCCCFLDCQHFEMLHIFITGVYLQKHSSVYSS